MVLKNTMKGQVIGLDGLDFGKATITVETIDPDRAAAIMAASTVRNRTVKTNRVDAYVRDMKAGNWLDTGDPIRIGPYGELWDGQHRLRALVQAGVTLQFVVMSGFPEGARMALDTGAHRSPGDHLAIAGVANHRHVAPIARRVIIVRAVRENPTISYKSLVPTHQEILAFVEAHSGALQDAAEVAFAGHGRLFAPASAVGAAYFVCAEIDAERALEFYMDAVVRGLGLTPGHAALALREFFQRRASGDGTGGRLDADNTYRYAISAWNRWRAGEHVVKISAPKGGWGTKFPEPK